MPPPGAEDCINRLRQWGRAGGASRSGNRGWWHPGHRSDISAKERVRRGRWRATTCPAIGCSADGGGGSLWFPGVVHSVGEDSVAIQYDDGTREIRPASQVKPYDWRIGARVDTIWSGDGRWYEATIVAMDDEGSALTVRFEDGVVEETVTGRCRSQ